MTKVEIIALAEKWEAAAQRAEARYQDSGAARHLREKEQAEDLAAAVGLAPSGLSARVRGRTPWSLPEAAGACSLLGADLAEFVHFFGSRKAAP